MVRTLVGIVVGVVCAAAIVAVVESLGHMIFPPPAGVDMKDPQALKTIMHQIPFGAKAAVLVAWGLGVFGGGLVAKVISKGAPNAVWAVAAVMLVFSGITLVMIPHPVWMIVGAVVVTVIGALAADRVIKFER